VAIELFREAIDLDNGPLDHPLGVIVSTLMDLACKTSHPNIGGMMEQLIELWPREFIPAAQQLIFDIFDLWKRSIGSDWLLGIVSRLILEFPQDSPSLLEMSEQIIQFCLTNLSSDEIECHSSLIDIIGCMIERIDERQFFNIIDAAKELMVEDRSYFMLDFSVVFRQLLAKPNFFERQDVVGSLVQLCHFGIENWTDPVPVGRCLFILAAIVEIGGQPFADLATVAGPILGVEEIKDVDNRLFASAICLLSSGLILAPEQTLSIVNEALLSNWLGKQIMLTKMSPNVFVTMSVLGLLVLARAGCNAALECAAKQLLTIFSDEEEALGEPDAKAIDLPMAQIDLRQSFAECVDECRDLFDQLSMPLQQQLIQYVLPSAKDEA
jgi:hypothetical protein